MVPGGSLGASQNLFEAFSALVQKLLASKFFEAAEKESKQTRAEGAARDDEPESSQMEQNNLTKLIMDQMSAKITDLEDAEKAQSR